MYEVGGKSSLNLKLSHKLPLPPTKRPNMKIYIYLSENTKERLKETQRHYHVSISTIAQILSDIVKPLMKKYDNDFFVKYLDGEHRTKTTIKPNNTKENSEFFNAIKFETSTASHIYSNILYWYANEKYDLIFNETNDKLLNKYKKELEKEFLKKKEIFWNYNASLRNQVRIVRKNADYFKRILNT